MNDDNEDDAGMNIDYEFDVTAPSASWWSPALLDNAALVTSMILFQTGWTYNVVDDEGIDSHREEGIITALHCKENGTGNSVVGVYELDYSTAYVLVHALIQNMPDDIARAVVSSLMKEQMMASAGNLAPSAEVRGAMTREFALRIRQICQGRVQGEGGGES